MDHGSFVENGSYEELISNKGLFQEMVSGSRYSISGQKAESLGELFPGLTGLHEEERSIFFEHLSPILEPIEFTDSALIFVSEGSCQTGDSPLSAGQSLLTKPNTPIDPQDAQVFALEKTNLMKLQTEQPDLSLRLIANLLSGPQNNSPQFPNHEKEISKEL